MNYKEKINALLKEGKTRSQIEGELSISSFTLSKYLPKRTSELGERILELRKERKSLTEIKEILKCSKSTISKYLSQQDIGENHIRDEKRKEIFEKKLSNKENIFEGQKSKGSKNGSLNYDLRKRKKEFLISIVNGCQVCGYNKYKGVLSFHHKDELTKHFGISGNILIKYGIQRLINEAEKCILLCSNCHGEVHGGVTDVSNIKTLDYSNTKIPENLLNSVEISKEELEKELEWIKNREVKRKIKEIDLKISTLDNVSIKEGSYHELNSILEDYHYLGKNLKGFIKNIIFYDCENIIGGCSITNPIRKNFNGKPTCEINRFVLLSHSKNLASKILSLVIKELKKENKFTYVQSYAEIDKHLGTIYKASNFKCIPGNYKTYNYSGIHKKTVYERARRLGISEYEYSQKFGLEKIVESPKSKFVYELI